MKGRDSRIDVRRQRLDVRGGGFLEDLERLEVLEGLERLDARRRAMAKLGRKRNNNAIYARAYADITGVLYFLLSQVSHSEGNFFYFITLDLLFCFRHCFLLFFLRTLFLHPLSHFSVSSACSSSKDGLFYCFSLPR